MGLYSGVRARGNMALQESVRPDETGCRRNASSGIKVGLPPGLLLALSARVVSMEGVISHDADELVVRPFSPAATAVKAWQREYAAARPRKIKFRWTTW